jgi:hypothetical protein
MLLLAFLLFLLGFRVNSGVPFENIFGHLGAVMVMSAHKELREKAWRLINEAKNSTGPKRRRMLIGEAFELLQRASSRTQRQSTGGNEATPEVDPYRICFLMTGSRSGLISMLKAKQTPCGWRTQYKKPAQTNTAIASYGGA